MMNYFYSFLINLRDLYKYQTKKIILVEKNNEIIKTQYIGWIIQLFSVLNLNYLINKFEYNYLFLIDDMYFYHTKNKPTNKIVFSVINSCYVKSPPITFDITENILKYNLQIPMFMIIENEKIQNSDTIEFSILHLGKMINKSYSVEEIKYKKLSEII